MAPTRLNIRLEAIVLKICLQFLKIFPIISRIIPIIPVKIPTLVSTVQNINVRIRISLTSTWTRYCCHQNFIAGNVAHIKIDSVYVTACARLTPWGICSGGFRRIIEWCGYVATNVLVAWLIVSSWGRWFISLLKWPKTSDYMKGRQHTRWGKGSSALESSAAARLGWGNPCVVQASHWHL